MPVVRDVVEAWAVKLPGPAWGPPVTWDGLAYVMCGAPSGGGVLVAADVARGGVVASKPLPKAPAAPVHVWAGVVYAMTGDSQLTGLRRAGRTFLEGWKYTARDFAPEGMAVLENEVYAVSKGTLLRLAPGSRKPVWSLPQGFVGEPAILGDTVLCLSGNGVRLWCGRRRDGAAIDTARIVEGGMFASRAQITVGSQYILVRSRPVPFSEAGIGPCAFLTYSLEGKEVKARAADGYMEFGATPAAYKDQLIACDRMDCWLLWQGESGRVLAHRQYTPGLFTHPVAPTVLGDVVYFGAWAADIETGEVLWRLPLESVRFGAVPADRLVLVIDSKDTLRAYRSRFGG
jgi:outer membrane protein assembly factor BamB